MMTNVPIIGWAKPVPVNGRNLHNARRDFVLVAAAGPASNLALAVLAALVWRMLPPGPEDLLATVVQRALLINVLLAVFNMIPVPPLDGGNVLAGLLPLPLARQYDRLRPWGFLLLYGLMLTGLLSTIVVPPARLILAWLL
jgi:Zn-dependent protease